MANNRMKDHELEKQYKREWYYRNRQRIIDANKARKQEIKQWFEIYRSTLKCTRCGFDHPAVLDFHHLDPSEKEANVVIMVHEGYAKERILEEIAKCIVVCANCHRIIHYEASPERVERSQANLEDSPPVPQVGT